MALIEDILGRTSIIIIGGAAAMLGFLLIPEIVREIRSNRKNQKPKEEDFNPPQNKKENQK